MRRRWIILSTAVLVAVLCGVVALRPREPRYEGRTLSQWVGDLDSRQPEVDARATEAVRHLGTNAIPSLVGMIQRKDSALKQRVMIIMSERNFPGAQNFKNAGYWQNRACCAFRILGRSAEPAAPAMVAVLNDGQACLDIAIALPWLGPAGVSGLTDALAHASAPRLMQMCMAMSVYATDFRSGAMPSQDQDFVFQACTTALVSRLAEQDFFVRNVALSSLERLQVKPDVVLSVLTNNLTRQDLFPHWSELEALGRFGPSAKAAVPALRKYAQEADIAPARAAALKALEKIDPAAAAEVRPK